MAGIPVTDPAILAELNAQPAAPAAGVPVTDPGILAQLNSAAGSALESVADVTNQAGVGITKGVAGLAGLGGDLQGLLRSARDYLKQRVPELLPAENPRSVANAQRFAGRGDLGPSFPLPTSKQVNDLFQSILGEYPKPKTTFGKYARTTGEFLPAAGRRVISMAAIPGVASETAGQLTEGTAMEPWARAGTAFASGGLAALATRPGTAERALRQQLPEGFNGPVFTQAENLMRDAQARGVNLTWAEAIEQVAPGTGLVNMQRILESSPGGREVMGPVMAQRPGQIDAAARQTFDTIAPPNQAPSTIGPAVGTAAEGEINRVRQSINAVAEPYYNRASTVLLTPQEYAQVRTLPGWEEARNAIRNDPQLNRYVAGLPDDSVGFLNEVKKYLTTAADNATQPISVQGRNMQRSAGYGRDADTVRDTAVNATLGNPARNYETALAIEAQGRSQFLDPLLQGPLGKMAGSDKTTKQAIDALFPANPLPASAGEVTTAVTALNRQNPRAARDLVRAHVESTFNEAAQNLQGGANQFGGAKFAAIIAGNPQQRSNLQAAVEAVGGPQAWHGFERFLNIVEATGTRQAIGSRTAFNAQELKDLATGSLPAAAGKATASPNRLFSIVADSWGRWQLGQNLDQLARIITDPNAAPILRRISQMPADSRNGQLLAARLVNMTQLGFNKEPNN